MRLSAQRTLQMDTMDISLDSIGKIKACSQSDGFIFLFEIFWSPLTLPALLVGLKLVTPRLGHPGGCTGEPDTKEHERRIHLHVSNSTEGKPLLSVRIFSPPHFGALCLPETSSFVLAEELRQQEESSNNGSYTGLFYGLRGKHPTVLNLHSGKSNFD